MKVSGIAAAELNRARVSAAPTKHAMPLVNGGSWPRAARLPQTDAALGRMDRH